MKINGVKIKTGYLLYVRENLFGEYHWLITCKNNYGKWIAITVDDSGDDKFYFLSDIKHDPYLETQAIYGRSVMNKFYFKSGTAYRKALWKL